MPRQILDPTNAQFLKDCFSDGGDGLPSSAASLRQANTIAMTRNVLLRPSSLIVS
jgi:hypothetical protein